MAAESHPEAVFLRSGAAELSYSASWQAICALGRWLTDKGVCAGDRVVLVAKDPLRVALVAFAVSATGGTFIVLHPETRPENLRHVLAETKPSLVVGDDAGLDAQCARAVLLDSETWTAALRPSVSKTIAGGDAPGSDAACIIYTSGSTGVARGVVMSHQSILFVCKAIQARLQYRREDAVGVYLPLAFDYGLYQMFLAAQVGATVVLGRLAYVGPGLPRYLVEGGVTVFAGVPNSLRILVTMLERRPQRIPQVRAITSTGEHLGPKTIADLQRVIPDVAVYSMYGLTECKRVSIALPGETEKRPSTVGRPLDGTAVHVVGPGGNALARGEIGELVVVGPHIANGYIATEVEDERFRMYKGERALFTGDLGCLDDGGFLYVYGRLDTLTKHRGYRLSPVEIERAAERCVGVRAAVVVRFARAQRLTLVVTLRDGTGAEDLARGLGEILEPYKMPDEIKVLESLPMNANGKIDRAAVAQLFAQQ